MKKIFYLLIGILLSMPVFSGNVNRIDPPMWWTGFENPNLQLMVYGEEISNLNPEINYKGVTIYAVTKAQSPNYLFIDLKIDENTQPGTFDILFKNGKKVVSTYAYQLDARSEGSAARASFEILMDGDKGVGDGDIRREMPGGWAYHDRSVFNEQGRTPEENEIFNYLKTLINWRNDNPVIHNGQLLHFIPQNNVYTYFRMNKEKTVMVVLNNNTSNQTFDPLRFNQVISAFKSGTDVMNGNRFDVTKPFELIGKTALVLELK